MIIQNIFQEMDQQICGANLSQTIFDIAIVIGSIENLASQWTPKFSLEIYFQIQNTLDSPSPYQIIHCKKIWNSSISLECYSVDDVQLGPKQRKQIKQACIFRSSLPISWLQHKELTSCINVISEGNKLGTLKCCFESAIGLHSYLPIFSPSLGIKIQAKIETQVLGLRIHKNCLNDPFESIYKGIQYVLHQRNRLTGKMRKLNLKYRWSQNRQKMTQIEINQSHLKEHMQYCNQNDVQNDVDGQTKRNQLSEDKQKQVTSQIYQQYQQIKSFREARIFKSKSQEIHKQKLMVFLNKFSYHISNPLQWNWQTYLQNYMKQNMKQHLEELRKAFCQQFALQIKNKISKNNKRIENKQYELTIGKLKLICENFSLICHMLEKCNQTSQQILNFEGIIDRHLVVLVHGYGANSLAMTYIERTLQYLFPHLDILNSKCNENPGLQTNIEAMGRNLATEVEQYMQKYQDPENVDISFIGYSLGGLVVRASLVHLQVFKLNMNSFISLSVPHLGHVSHMNKFAKLGMIAINSIWHSNVIDNLLLKDNKNQRLSFLYSLSLHSGLSWFKSINLYGSADDGYVSLNSSLVTGKNQNYANNSQIVEQMSNNINYSMSNSKISKFEILFQLQKNYKLNLTEWIVGKESHLAFATCQTFINCFLLQNYRYFKYNQIKLFQEEMN